jgi:hypothetical protein
VSENKQKGLFSPHRLCVIPINVSGITYSHVGKRLFTNGVDALLSLIPPLRFLEIRMDSFGVCLCLFQKDILSEWATNVANLIMFTPSFLSYTLK